MPPTCPAQPLYQQLYCGRGEMENRIKEQFSLFSDRTSTAYLRSNQLRLYLSSIAYLLLEALSAIGSERHCNGQGAVPNHPAQTAQGGRTGARHRTQGLGVVLQRLPGPGAVRPCLSATPLLTRAAVQLFDNSFALLCIIPRSSASALSTLLPFSDSYSRLRGRVAPPCALPC